MNRSLNTYYYYIDDYHTVCIHCAADRMDSNSSERYFLGNYFESRDEVELACFSQTHIFSDVFIPRCKYKDRYWYIYQYHNTYRVTSKLEEFSDKDCGRYYHNNYFYNKKDALQAITDRLYERPNYDDTIFSLT